MTEKNSELTKKQRRELRKEKLLQERMLKKKSEMLKKRLQYSVIGIILIGVIVGIVYVIASQPILPSKTAQGHIEDVPDSHILDEPMDLRVHKHMLEHADGSGPPGIIINYNCIDFACDNGMIEELEGIVSDYPENVYLAPYTGMSEMLVITKSDKQEVLDGFDREKIIDFIED